MYKVFFNDRKIIITNQYELCKDGGKTEFTKYSNELELRNTIFDFRKNSFPETLIIYSASVEELWEAFKKNFLFLEASGGLVRHSNGKFLFIFRRNKWDLPKGKLEKNESVELGAIREVEEETGVGNLRISKHLVDTWHCYDYRGSVALKITHWFLMDTDYNKTLIPQTTEDITEATWVSSGQIPQLLTNSLPSIIDVWDNYKQESY